MSNLKPVADISNMFGETEEHKTTHWQIYFEVRVPALTEAEKQGLLGPAYREGVEISPWLTDELTLQGGPNGLDVIRFVQALVMDRERYQLPVQEFKLLGLELISEAEMVID